MDDHIDMHMAQWFGDQSDIGSQPWGKGTEECSLWNTSQRETLGIVQGGETDRIDRGYAVFHHQPYHPRHPMDCCQIVRPHVVGTHPDRIFIAGFSDRLE